MAEYLIAVFIITVACGLAALVYEIRLHRKAIEDALVDDVKTAETAVTDKIKQVL